MFSNMGEPMIRFNSPIGNVLVGEHCHLSLVDDSIAKAGGLVNPWGHCDGDHRLPHL